MKNILIKLVVLVFILFFLVFILSKDKKIVFSNEGNELEKNIKTEVEQEKKLLSENVIEKNIGDSLTSLKSSREGDNKSISKLMFRVNTAASPKGMAFSPDGKEFWVASLMNKNSGLVVHDAKTGKITNRISFGNGGGVEVIFSKNGEYAYVSQMETASVFEIDADTKKVSRTFDTQSAWTKVIALSHDGSKLYASNWSGNDVSEFDLSTGKLIRRIKTVKTPRGIYITKDNKHMYVAGYDKGELQKIDLENLSSKILYDKGSALRHIVVDKNEKYMYISDMGKKIILKMDLVANQIVDFAHTDINPNTIDLSNDDKILFVSCRGKNFSSEDYYQPGPEWGTVLLFDTASGKMIDAIVGGNQPTALDISNDGKVLVFSDFLDAQLEFYQVASYKEYLNNSNSEWLKSYKNFIIKN